MTPSKEELAEFWTTEEATYPSLRKYVSTTEMTITEAKLTWRYALVTALVTERILESLHIPPDV